MKVGNQEYNMEKEKLHGPTSLSNISLFSQAEFGMHNCKASLDYRTRNMSNSKNMN